MGDITTVKGGPWFTQLSNPMDHASFWTCLTPFHFACCEQTLVIEIIPLTPCSTHNLPFFHGIYFFLGHTRTDGYYWYILYFLLLICIQLIHVECETHIKLKYWGPSAEKNYANLLCTSKNMNFNINLCQVKMLQLQSFGALYLSIPLCSLLPHMSYSNPMRLSVASPQLSLKDSTMTST